MDINDLVYSDTAEMVVTDHEGNPMLDGKKKQMIISFYSDDTDERLRAYAGYRKALIEAGKDHELQLDAECKLLSDITERFENVIYEGKPATLKDAKSIYRKIHKLRQDALIFVGNNVNFIKGHLKN